jgi:spoIIIJ-associated protein
MSEYQEFTGKTVEEALRNAREAFGVGGLDDLDFEILTPGSRGVLGMGAEPARIVAAPRAALGGAAPKREAAATQPLPPPPPREPRREFGRDGDRGRGVPGGAGGPGGPGRDRGRGRFDDRGRRPEGRPPREDRPPRFEQRPVGTGAAPAPAAEGGRFGDRPDRGPDRGSRRDRRGDSRGEARGRMSPVGDSDAAELAPGRASLSAERAELQAAEASEEALASGKAILEELMRRLGFDVEVALVAGETSRLNVIGTGTEKEALGALIGRKGERLSALQHLVNLMLSKEVGEWTRVLVDVEDYRGRRERQLRELAYRAAERVAETGKMLQLEPMPALERRWVHLSLRDNPDVATQSIGEEPNRRVVVLPRNA